MPQVTIDNKNVAHIVRVGAFFTVFKNGVAVITYGYPSPLKNAKAFCDKRGWPYHIIRNGRKTYVDKLLESMKAQA